MKMYRSQGYRKVMSFLLRKGRLVLTKDLLAILGVPDHPARAEYNRGHLLVRRLIKRQWLAATPTGSGHVNFISLTTLGTEIAQQWENEAGPLVSIYAGNHEISQGTAASVVLRSGSGGVPHAETDPPADVGYPAPSAGPPSAGFLTCDVCSDRVQLQRARDAYRKFGEVLCDCGNNLTNTYLDLIESVDSG